MQEVGRAYTGEISERRHMNALQTKSYIEFTCFEFRNGYFDVMYHLKDDITTHV